MKTKNLSANFIWGASNNQYPKHKFPEIAFAGRSNVGKSSLINSIVQRKNLAHISSTPGKTQSINFYTVEDQWCLVDMPGFGYAQRGKEFQEYWKKENVAFMLNRENIKFVNVLIDSRVKVQARDLELIELLENNGREYLVILTKTDKISEQECKAKKEEFEYLTAACKSIIEVLPYSSINNTGRESLLAIIKRKIK